MSLQEQVLEEAHQKFLQQLYDLAGVVDAPFPPMQRNAIDTALRELENTIIEEVLKHRHTYVPVVYEGSLMAVCSACLNPQTFRHGKFQEHTPVKPKVDTKETPGKD